MYIYKIQELSAHMGVEVLLFATRASHDHYTQPRVLATNPRLETFFKTMFNRTTTDFCYKLEAFVISGIDGTSIITL